jgi:uncharacterized protein YdhG (YjbR/CyaY superfamily)
MPFQDVDSYLAALPEEQRVALQRLRDLIRAADHQAVESISYGIPTFKHNQKPLIYIGAAKSHCAVYGPAVDMVRFADELRRFSKSKGTIRFQPDDPLPDDLVLLMVRARLEALDQT